MTDQLGASPFGVRVAGHAAIYIGTSEQPLGSNHGRLIDLWAKKAAGVEGGIPWCACFMWCMALDCGQRLRMQYPASVLSWVLWAYKTGRVVKRPFRGDFVAYSWSGPTPDPGDHIGIVERVYALPWQRNGTRWLIKTIEGNSGDKVTRQLRWVKIGDDPADPSTPHVVFIRVF